MLLIRYVLESKLSNCPREEFIQWRRVRLVQQVRDRRPPNLDREVKLGWHPAEPYLTGYENECGNGIRIPRREPDCTS